MYADLLKFYITSIMADNDEWTPYEYMQQMMEQEKQERIDDAKVHFKRIAEMENKHNEKVAELEAKYDRQTTDIQKGMMHVSRSFREDLMTSTCACSLLSVTRSLNLNSYWRHPVGMMWRIDFR